MKKMLQFALVFILLVSFVMADITPISSIQDTTGTGSEESPMVGEEVTIQGIISAESWAYGNEYYFVQDAEEKWSGIKVDDYGRGTVYGDSVQITGTVEESYGITQITSVSEYVVLDSNKTVEPVVVTTGQIGTGGTESESYESVLVRVLNADISSADEGYGQWLINDGSGDVMVDDEADYYFNPGDYDMVKSITGPLFYAYGDYKIIPRLAYDIVEGGDYVRLQKIQQVRYSDLVKAPNDNVSDISYHTGDTLTVKGIVTMPTGLSYAGAGIKFIFQQEGGGPWSSILSYNSDSSAYPQLWEGDLIEMTGYIEEYGTGPANMTEFFITSPINILNFGVDTPPVDTINTGDLRHPTTAEQWGNNIVAMKDAEVINLNPQYELFSIDDGTGEILVDDDSDSLDGYPDPPAGALLESISGWVYHHYGTYVDSSTYKLEPLYPSDIVLGVGAPQLQNADRVPGVPTSSDPVTVSLDVTTNSTIDNVVIRYSVNNGDYMTTEMSTEDDKVYSGTIPAQEDGAWVEYFIEATDTDGLSSVMPGDTSMAKYGYVIKDDGLKISDIQYSPWELANSPFDKCQVEVTGIVTVDTAYKNKYGAIHLQSDAGAWNGITVANVTDFTEPGDEIKVYGTVEEYWSDWHYKWDNNTLIVADSIEVLTQGNSVPEPVTLTTGELATDSELYEGVLVTVNDGVITSLNSYDWSLDDGSGEILIDDDGANMDEWFGNLTKFDGIDYVTGPYLFSFGSYKIGIRNMDDVGSITDVDDSGIQVARSYRLEQNFPNPFNPETRIYFEIPETEMVTVAIYNVLGKKVRILESSRFSAGRYTLNWDGKNDNGYPVPSGTYIYRMKAGSFISSKKMVLLK